MSDFPDGADNDVSNHDVTDTTVPADDAGAVQSSLIEPDDASAPVAAPRKRASRAKVAAKTTAKAPVKTATKATKAPVKAAKRIRTAKAAGGAAGHGVEQPQLMAEAEASKVTEAVTPEGELNAAAPTADVHVSPGSTPEPSPEAPGADNPGAETPTGEVPTAEDNDAQEDGTEGDDTDIVAAAQDPEAAPDAQPADAQPVDAQPVDAQPVAAAVEESVSEPAFVRPVFGLVFQAPQAPASRRASRPAGAATPHPVPDATTDRATGDRSERAVDSAGDTSPTADPTARTTGSDNAGDVASASGGNSGDGPRSRTRGRRRGRGAPPPQAAEGTQNAGQGSDDRDDERPDGDTQDVDTPEIDTHDVDTPDTDAQDTATQDDVGPDGVGQGDGDESTRARRRRRGGRGRRSRADEAGDAAYDDAGETGDEAQATGPGTDQDDAGDDDGDTPRRRRRRRRSGSGEAEDPPGTVTKLREPRRERDEPTAVRGSTRLEAKKMRRREGREAGRRRTIITEKEFLARRESVERVMVVRRRDGRTQIGVLEDGILVEHYVSRTSNASLAGNVYLGRVQNVLPSMEAAFVDIGKGRNAVLYAGEVNWDTAGLEPGGAKRIENVHSSGSSVLVQVTKDPIGHKGARLTSQISLPGRYLVYVPQGNMTGISRKLPDTERARLKSILKEIVPPGAGVIVRTAAEGASEEELRRDVERLAKTWEKIESQAKAKAKAKVSAGGAPVLLNGEPDLTVRVIRDVFNEDFASLVVAGDDAWDEISSYVADVAPDLAPRMSKWTSEQDVFAAHRIDEQLAKALDRKVFLPSGGSLVIDRTEAMTVVDVNTGKFVGSGGNLEETVTKNNIEAAEEIVRQLRLRDIGGIIVIDFIDMVLESNRDLVVRRLLECLGRDRTKHQVAEVTSLGLVQMTRKRVASGLLEVFSEPCAHCDGRGLIVSTSPVDGPAGDQPGQGNGAGGRNQGGAGQGGGNQNGGGDNGGSPRSRRGRDTNTGARPAPEQTPPRSGPTAAQIAAAAHAAAVKGHDHSDEAVLDIEVAEVSAPLAAPPTDAPHPADTTSPGSAAAEAPESTPVESLPAGVTPAEAEPTPVEAPIAPTTRPRRRRGRATAPAGPPKPHAGDGSGEL